jgi:hypothetical protein
MEVPISARFDEPIAAGSLGNEFRLIHLGADETLTRVMIRGSGGGPVIGPAEYALDFSPIRFRSGCTWCNSAPTSPTSRAIP